MNDDTKTKIIIEGVTETGETFRPSDWAERIGGQLCLIRERRTIYSPLLQPIMKDGNKCVVIDLRLKQSNPELYESILNFAKVNKLKISQEK